MSTKSYPPLSQEELAEEVWEDESPTSYLSRGQEDSPRSASTTVGRDGRHGA
jgi:hypothetical protein